MKKNKFRLPISAYVTYLLLASFLLTGVTFSKYVAKTSTSDNARVAKFGVEMVGASNASFALEAGGEETYSFTVKNVSDVTLMYKLVLKNLPAGISVSVSDGKAYDAERELAIGASAPLSLTFSADSDAEDIDGSVDISVEAEQAN